MPSDESSRLNTPATFHDNAGFFSPREKELQYLELAKTYLECNEPKLSLKCLSYAKEFQLSAQLCERLGKVWSHPRVLLEEWGFIWANGGGAQPLLVSGRGSNS